MPLRRSTKIKPFKRSLRKLVESWEQVRSSTTPSTDQWFATPVNAEKPKRARLTLVRGTVESNHVTQYGTGLTHAPNVLSNSCSCTPEAEKDRAFPRYTSAVCQQLGDSTLLGYAAVGPANLASNDAGSRNSVARRWRKAAPKESHPKPIASMPQISRVNEGWAYDAYPRLRGQVSGRWNKTPFQPEQGQPATSLAIPAAIDQHATADSCEAEQRKCAGLRHNLKREHSRRINRIIIEISIRD